MPIIHAEGWTIGAVRIRANAIDRYAGLRGRGYIAARELDRPVGRLDAGCEIKAEAMLKIFADPTRRPA